jgi:prephenate dehydrogenase
MHAHVIGYDTNADVLPRALDLGAIDERAASIADAVRDADVVFAAVPIGELVGVLEEVLQAAGPRALISDVGSTKRKVFHMFHDDRFVGGHPLAGGEKAGVEHARHDLFDGAVWYLTTRGDSNLDAAKRLSTFVASFGARPVPIDAGVHDRLMARVSHLPHVLANVLVEEAESVLIDQAASSKHLFKDGQPFQASDVVGRTLHQTTRMNDDSQGNATLVFGPSFRDATRVAGANSGIWTDIYLSNREALCEAIDDTIKRLLVVREVLADHDAEALTAWNEHARLEREKLKRSGLTPDTDT